MIFNSINFYSMPKVSFGKTNIQVVYDNLIANGFTDNPKVGFCSFGAALLSPKGYETGFLMREQIPASSGNLEVVFSIKEGDLPVIKSIPGFSYVFDKD